MQSNQKKIVAASIVGLLVVGAVISGVFYFANGNEEKFKYNPTVALPTDYMIFVEQPVNEKQMAFVAALSSLAVHVVSPGAPQYHAMFILKDGKLSEHQLATIETLSNKDAPKLVFAPNGIAPEGLSAQIPIDEKLVFDTKGKSIARFFSYTDFISVGSYREALWVSPLANLENKVDGVSAF